MLKESKSTEGHAKEIAAGQRGLNDLEIPEPKQEYSGFHRFQVFKPQNEGEKSGLKSFETVG